MTRTCLSQPDKYKMTHCLPFSHENLIASFQFDASFNFKQK